MRRLRRGQAGAAEPAPAAELDAIPLEDEAPAPETPPSVLHPAPPEPADETLERDDGSWLDDDEPPDDDDVFAFAPATAAPPPPPVAAPAPALPPGQALRLGLLDACREAVDAGETAELAPLLAALADGEAVLRGLGLGGDAAERSVMLAVSPGAGGLAVVFGEDDGGFHLSPLAGRGVHILYVRDAKRSLAMLGVPGLGEDYDACLLGILRIARALNAADVFCLGGGAACYSALRFGLDLGAAGVLAAGTLDHVRRGVQAPGLRPGTQVRRLMRLAAELGPGMPDAYAAATVRPGLVLCRPGPSALGRLAALPGAINVDAPPGALARMWEWLEQSGRLPDLIDHLLACRPVE